MRDDFDQYVNRTVSALCNGVHDEISALQPKSIMKFHGVPDRECDHVLRSLVVSPRGLVCWLRKYFLVGIDQITTPEKGGLPAEAAAVHVEAAATENLAGIE